MYVFIFILSISHCLFQHSHPATVQGWDHCVVFEQGSKLTRVAQRVQYLIRKMTRCQMILQRQ